MKKRKERGEDEDPVKLPKRQKLAEAAKSCMKIMDMYDIRAVSDLGMERNVSKEVDRMEVEDDSMPDQKSESIGGEDHAKPDNVAR